MVLNKGISMQTMTNSVQTPIISAILALIKILGLETATGEYSTSRSARGLRDVIGLQNKV